MTACGITPGIDTDWIYKSGRDADGDLFSIHALVHGSGRVLGKVFGPSAPDEFVWRAAFYCAVPKDILDTGETFDFIDAESAMKFIESILQQFDPFAPPAAVRAAAVAKKAKEPAELA